MCKASRRIPVATLAAAIGALFGLGDAEAASRLSIGNRGTERIPLSVGAPSGAWCGSATIPAQSSASFADGQVASRHPERGAASTYTVTWRRTAEPDETHRCHGTATANSFYTVVQARGPEERDAC